MHKSNMLAVIQAFEEAGVIFTEPTKTRGPGIVTFLALSLAVIALPVLLAQSYFSSR